MKIYHNPRCTKSRQGLALLQNSGVDFEIIEYLKTPLTKDELKDLLQKLGIPASELIRKNEAIWKEQFKNKDLTEAELIDAMIEFPKLIERPIVVNGNTAVIGRPTENISTIL
jgi:arsenate reductase